MLSGHGDTLTYRWPSEERDATDWLVTDVDVVPEGRNRVDGVNDAIMFVQAAQDSVQSCYVSADPTNLEGVRQAVSATFGPDFVVTDLVDRDQNRRSYDEMLQARLSPWIALAGAFALLLLQCVGWFARRADFALYRALGMLDGNVRRMLGWEAGILSLAPMSFGALLGTVSLAGSPGIALQASLLSYAAVLLVVAIIPALGSALVLRVSTGDTIKGR